MKIRFCAALLLAALAIPLFLGCSSVNALNHPKLSQDVLISEELTPMASAPAATETQPAAVQPKQITKAEAIAIVLAHANLTDDQVTRLRAEFGYDDGCPEYDVDFHYGGWEYDYEVHAETGAILYSECELADPEPTKASHTNAAQTPTPATQPAASRLTKEEARTIALQHAGLSLDEVSRLRVELDYDDGQAEYDVDFYHNGYDYDYEINAETGRIISWDKDLND